MRKSGGLREAEGNNPLALYSIIVCVPSARPF